MSVAGSCFLQWTQKILTINKKLSRYIPSSYFLLQAISFSFSSNYDTTFNCMLRNLHHHCSEIDIFFLHCVCNITITRSVVDFSANATTRHTRLLAMKADLILEDTISRICDQGGSVAKRERIKLKKNIYIS